jgi:plastocyanin
MINLEWNLIRATCRVRRRSSAAPLCAWLLYALATSGASLAAESSAAAMAAVAATAQDSTIAIHNFMFNPMSLVVAVGTTVSWKNLDGEPHTIRSLDDTFRSGALDQNDSFSFKFDKPGTYRYACSIHPQMVATIVVK